MIGNELEIVLSDDETDAGGVRGYENTEGGVCRLERGDPLEDDLLQDTSSAIEEAESNMEGKSRRPLSESVSSLSSEHDAVE